MGSYLQTYFIDIALVDSKCILFCPLWKSVTLDQITPNLGFIEWSILDNFYSQSLLYYAF